MPGRRRAVALTCRGILGSHALWRRPLQAVKRLRRGPLARVCQCCGRRQQLRSGSEGDRAEVGRVPWGPGYEELKDQIILSTLRDEPTMKALAAGTPLPVGFGVGVDERCVEYPWLFARLPGGGGRLLDAGSGLNHPALLRHPLLREKKMHILTLFPEQTCSWSEGISYLFEDLRASPMRDDLYDWIVCVSTLEHIGCDNSIYTGDKRFCERKDDDYLVAMTEMRRMLRPGGQLFLTVPFGLYEHLGFQVQFDEPMLERAAACFGGTILSQAFYRYSRDGWQLSTASDCADCRYVGWIASAWRTGEWPEEIPREPDLAAAARGVACLHLAKVTG